MVLSCSTSAAHPQHACSTSAALREDHFLQNPQSLFLFSVKFIPNWLPRSFKVCFQVESLKDIHQPPLSKTSGSCSFLCRSAPQTCKHTLKCKINEVSHLNKYPLNLCSLILWICGEADWCCLILADQRVLHQGAETALSGLQQHRRLHLHVECHHDYSKVQAHMEKSFYLLISSVSPWGKGGVHTPS